MNLLALDGALGSFSAAIARNDVVVASTVENGNVALERGLSAVDAVFQQAALRSSDLNALAIGIGPGGFTGLRIAVAFAKSLSAVWKLPIVPVSSFDMLEFGQDLKSVLGVIVGRPGVISARYRNGSKIRRASGRTADVLNALDPAPGSALQVIGAPEDVLHALAERAISVIPVQARVTPPAAAAALAALRARAVPLHQVRADYGELPAVTPPKR